ncbi:MAG: response regulator [Selenomonadaceae bacterium]|nr:response regulator [Selenomonadaceae bacterium]
MDSEQNKIMKEFIIGALVVVVILIVGTFWMGNSISDDNEEAVRTVSLMYLDELAGRREQVVAGKLNDYIGDMNIAMDLLQKDDLSSVEKLQAYQSRMKQLYGLEKFAFVDTDGLIYTARGTRNDIAVYGFDYKNLTETEIFIKNISGNKKKIIIAMPADNLPFIGKTLTAAFMEIDMNRMLESVSLQVTGNNTTVCNIYTKDGLAFTNMVLGGRSSEKNLLDAMANADFEKGYSADKIKEDFENGVKGFAAFTYDDIKETIYYVPIHGTDWMLTYLIRESVVNEQFSSITAGIVSRSLAHSIITALALVAMFAAVIIQLRKTTKAQLEKETADAENRVKQQELEEQLALQEELLAQEQEKAQQDNMIRALASDYRSVYYVNIADDEGICYREDTEQDNAVAIREGEQFIFSRVFTEYANLYVTEEYRKEFLNFIDPKFIREGLRKDSVITYRYLSRRNDKESYEMIRMAGVRKPGEDPEKSIHIVGIGITDIDSEMRDSMEKSQALSDALKAAEEASKAKTTFLSSMSHEIRTPMNAIIGLDNLALHEPGISNTTKSYLEKIGTSAQHLLSLINDILDMSRIESGRMTVRNEEFSFPKLIEQINTIFSGQSKEKKLEYTCHINGHLDEYYIGDSVKLRQILINILGNAVKFTPEGGKVDLIVEKTADFDKKSAIRFTIKDTGIGMSREYLPKIFDAFSQENAGATNKYGSSGLGMAITKSIVEMMNGNIEVESEKGVGTTFKVTVTLMNSDKSDSASDDVEIKPHELNVLVIDDDPIACDHAKLILEKMGIAAEIALNGKEAIEMVKLRHARREPYNLIIVDWQMPEMNGIEATRQIREIIGNETAIIILTAYNWEDVADEAISAGVDSFIAKPLFSGALLEELKKAFKNKNRNTVRTKPKVDLTGRKILLAEDVEVNAEIMIMVLQMRDIEVELAANGKIALEKFENSPENYYDAILMDMRMPEMDGLEATQRIRALDRKDAKTIPIIALTANAFDEDVQRSLQAGLNAHLSKPVEPDVLFETLENMIKDK